MIVYCKNYIYNIYILNIWNTFTKYIIVNIFAYFTIYRKTKIKINKKNNKAKHKYILI